MNSDGGTAVMPVVDRVIVEHLDPEKLVPGGIDTCIHDLVKYGADVRFAIVGITSDPKRQIGRWADIEFAGRRVPFMPVARFDRSIKRGLLGRIPHSLRQALGTVRYRRLIPKGVWQAHRVETGYLLSWLRPSALVQLIHNDSLGLIGDNSDSSWKSLGRAYRWLERRVMKLADGVILFNQTDSARLRKLRNDLVVAQTWFDPETFKLRTTEPTSPLRICWVGRFEAQKDPVLAIKTFVEVQKLSHIATLEIVGEGSLGTAMRDEIRSNHLESLVSFRGSVPRAEVASLMRSSSVMLMTSHYEGSPRVLAEANATGLPIVATPGADPDHALVTEVNGIRITSRDAEELANALLEAQGYSSVACAESVAHRAAPRAVAALLEVGVGG